MTEQDFTKLSDTYQNSRTNWGELAKQLKPGIYSFGAFKAQFCKGVEVADSQVKWALRGKVKSATELSARVALRYNGSDMFIKVK